MCVLVICVRGGVIMYGCFGNMCMWGCYNVCVLETCVRGGVIIYGCFGNMCTCIYCVLYCFVYVYFKYICFVCTGVRTVATE
jgi:hypothetical protein